MDPGLHQWYQPVVPEGSRHENIEMLGVKNQFGIPVPVGFGRCVYVF